MPTPHPHTSCLTFLIFPCKVSFSSEEQRLLPSCSEFGALCLSCLVCVDRPPSGTGISAGRQKDCWTRSQMWGVGLCDLGQVTSPLWSSASSSEWRGLRLLEFPISQPVGRLLNLTLQREMDHQPSSLRIHSSENQPLDGHWGPSHSQFFISKEAEIKSPCPKWPSETRVCRGAWEVLLGHPKRAPGYLMVTQIKVSSPLPLSAVFRESRDL